MHVIVDLFILSLSAYGFALAVQILRGTRLNFKPFNCKFCLGIWYSLTYIILTNFIVIELMKPILYCFTVGCICYFLTLIEDKLSKMPDFSE